MPSINSIGAERQHAIAAAVEKQQPFAPIDGETARVDDAAVIAERTDGFASLSKARSAPYPLPFVPDALVTKRGIVATLRSRVRHRRR